MANPYRELFAVPGAGSFVAAAFVGRMSMSMVGIGIVLLVSAVTGSYGIAGAVSASFALAYAVASPIAGRLADRYGQGRVLAPMVIANGASMAALVLCAHLGAPTWTLFPTAVAAGLTSPSLGAMVRARWSHVLRTADAADRADDEAGGRPGDPAGDGAEDRAEDRADAGTDDRADDRAGPRLHAAFSLESVLDEVVFVTGPMIVTVLATGVHPAGGVVAAALLTLTGSLALSVQRGTEPPARARGPERAGAILAPGVLPITVVFLILGAVFGAIDVCGLAFAEEAGHPGLAGPLLALLAFGSGTAAVWYGARRWRAPLARRFRIGLALLVVGLVPPVLIGDLYVLMAVIFFSGLAISPTIISAYGLVESLVPRHRLTEGLTWMSTAIGIGIAVGASVAGRVIDAEGAGTAFLIPLGAGLLAAVVGGASRLSKREPVS